MEHYNTSNPLAPIELTPPSEKKVEKATKIMDNMVATGQITEAGLAFLKIATDPWHDNKIENFKGIPDQNTGLSVVCSIVQELDIAKPAGLPAGNWGVRIVTNPIAQPAPTTGYTMLGNVAVATGIRDAFLYPVSVDFAGAGVDFPDVPGYQPAGTASQGLFIPPQYLDGPYKVASMGVETVNTTAEINMQGLTTCGRMNQGATERLAMTLYKAVGVTSVATVFPVRCPPKNLSEMILLPDTTQWHAKEGAYSVVELASLGTLPPSCDPVYPLVLPVDFPTDAFTQVSVNLPQVQSITIGVVPVNSVAGIKPGHVPMNTTIQMFTGLSDATTLTLRVRWVIERYPNDNQPQILVLSTPTAAYDPAALELYARAMRLIPPGVMFKENNSQEWWKTMLAGIADLASSGLMMMPHPLAKGAGSAIALARNLLVPNTPGVKISKKSGQIKARKPKGNGAEVIRAPTKLQAQIAAPSAQLKLKAAQKKR
jgi:hypothetical protein